MVVGDDVDTEVSNRAVRSLDRPHQSGTGYPFLAKYSLYGNRCLLHFKALCLMGMIVLDLGLLSGLLPLERARGSVGSG